MEEATTTAFRDEPGFDEPDGASPAGDGGEVGRWVPSPAPFVFKLEKLDTIELDTEPQWLISGLMPSSGLHVLYGAPGTGKSFVALHAALHVAIGRTWAGRRVRQGGVVYVASEGGRNFRKRVVAARRSLQVPDGAPFALITQAPNLSGKDHQTEALIRDIKVQSRRLGFEPKLIILDTLSRSITDLRESDAQDIMKFVEHAQEIAEAFDALVLPIHHCGKDETKGMRGSSALHGAADAEWLVSRDLEAGVRHVSVEKMKDGPDKLKARYELEDVTLGKDDDGEPIVTCVAKVYDVEVDAPASDAPRAGTQEDRVLTALRVLADLEGCEAADPKGGSGKAVPLARLKGVLASSGALAVASGKTGDVALSRALASLQKRGAISRDAQRVVLFKKEDASSGEEGTEVTPMEQATS